MSTPISRKPDNISKPQQLNPILDNPLPPRQIIQTILTSTLVAVGQPNLLVQLSRPLTAPISPQCLLSLYHLCYQAYLHSRVWEQRLKPNKSRRLQETTKSASTKFLRRNPIFLRQNRMRR